METQKSINLLNDSSNEESKFATKSLCDYSHAFILVTGNITVNEANDSDVVF